MLPGWKITAVYGNQGQSEWDQLDRVATELKNREKAALAEEREKLAKEVRFYCFQQFCFFKQWTALKAYANDKGVEMIGDIPIYVAFDSADAWAQPELFQFDKENIPIGVAGCRRMLFCNGAALGKSAL